jgi:beta-glucanase (GH16 family)
MKKLLVFCSMLALCTGSAYALPKVVTDTLKWGLAWSDEFNGTSLDTVNNWSYDTGSGQPNAEQEFYTRGCVEVSNGALHIWSKYNPNGSNGTATPDKAKYTSGRVNTGDKQIFTYGYFEAAIQGPIGTGGKNGPGLWSAVWMLGNSINHGVAWPTCGEMELYEQRTCSCVVGANAAQPVPAIAGDDEFIACCHYGVNGGASYHSCQHNYSKCLCDRFHTYGILWDSTDVHYYWDDTLFWGPNIPSAAFTTPSINTVDNKVAFHNPFFWIINVAVGGAYQGQNIDNSIFPTHMDLDYVRVYQKGGNLSTVRNDLRYHAPQSYALVNPSTAQLKVYDMRGQLVADYTNKVRQMKAGDNVMKMIPAMLSRGAYVVRLVDNGNSFSQNLVSMK